MQIAHAAGQAAGMGDFGRSMMRTAKYAYRLFSRAFAERLHEGERASLFVPVLASDSKDRLVGGALLITERQVLLGNREGGLRGKVRIEAAPLNRVRDVNLHEADGHTVVEFTVRDYLYQAVFYTGDLNVEYLSRITHWLLAGWVKPNFTDAQLEELAEESDDRVVASVRRHTYSGQFDRSGVGASLDRPDWVSGGMGDGGVGRIGRGVAFFVTGVASLLNLLFGLCILSVGVATLLGVIPDVSGVGRIFGGLLLIGLGGYVAQRTWRG